jgi:cell division ATPase FtsA
VLCLQLNRLDFENAEPIKRKHKVHIEKQIFVDRFMYKNKEKSE